MKLNAKQIERVETVFNDAFENKGKMIATFLKENYESDYTEVIIELLRDEGFPEDVWIGDVPHQLEVYSTNNDWVDHIENDAYIEDDASLDVLLNDETELVEFIFETEDFDFEVQINITAEEYLEEFPDVYDVEKRLDDYLDANDIKAYLIENHGEDIETEAIEIFMEDFDGDLPDEAQIEWDVEYNGLRIDSLTLAKQIADTVLETDDRVTNYLENRLYDYLYENDLIDYTPIVLTEPEDIVEGL